MATNSTKLAPGSEVTGWVEKFFYGNDRRYGFVSAHVGTVHVHADNCRVFSGTPEAPVITDERVSAEWLDEHLVAAFPGRHLDYSYVVMNVVPGGRGPRAVRWAVIPRRGTVEDVLKYGGLDAYIGLELGVMPVSDKAAGGTWGVLETWKLSDHRLELTLSSAHGSGIEPAQYGAVTKVLEFERLRVTDDDPSHLTLRLHQEDQPALQVVCWRRPPLD